MTEKLIKGFVIDPFDQTIREHVVGQHVLRDIYAAIQADVFDIARFDESLDTVYVDDEGLFKPDQAFFMIRGYTNPLAGRGLVLGSDDQGNSQDAKISLEDLTARVEFMTHEDLRQFLYSL